MLVDDRDPDNPMPDGYRHNGGPPIDDSDSPFGPAGYIKVARDMRDHPLVGFGSTGKYSRAEAFLDLIMECRWAPGEVWNKGRRMRIERGQLLGAISWLAARWNWSPKAVRWFLDRLEEEQMLTRSAPQQAVETRGLSVDFPSTNRGYRKGNQVSVLNICNYDIYQFVVQMQRQAEGQANGKPTASQGHDLKKGRKEESSIPPYPPNGGQPPPAATTRKTDGPTPTDALHAFEAYNATALRIGLQQAAKLTPDRQRKLIARLREYGADGWAKAMSNLERSGFLRGRNPQGWRANLDFVLQPSSFGKLVDGAYADKATPNAPGSRAPQRSMTTEEEQALLARIDAELNGRGH